MTFCSAWPRSSKKQDIYKDPLGARLFPGMLSSAPLLFHTLVLQQKQKELGREDFQLWTRHRLTSYVHSPWLCARVPEFYLHSQQRWVQETAGGRRGPQTQ